MEASDENILNDNSISISSLSEYIKAITLIRDTLLSTKNGQG